MEMLVFDGQYDAYFWVLCADKYFKVRGILEDEKMAFVAMAMNGCALKWWRWWYPRHPEVTWDSFTLSFLWRFKPEDRVILPIVDDEEEPNQELPSLNSNSDESLNNVLLAWDKFLTSTEHIDVPTLQVSNLNVAKYTSRNDFNDEVLNLQDSTTKLMEETEESLGENHFEDPNRFADLDFKYTLTASPPSVVNRRVFDEMPLRTRMPQTDIPHQFRKLMIRLGVFNIPDKLPPPKPPDRQIVSTPPLPPNVITMCKTASTSAARGILSFSTGHTVIPIVGMGGIFCYGTIVLEEFVNIKSSFNTHQVFVESPFETTFSWNLVLFQDIKAILSRLQPSSLQIVKLIFRSVFSCLWHF